MRAPRIPLTFAALSLLVCLVGPGRSSAARVDPPNPPLKPWSSTGGSYFDAVFWGDDHALIAQGRRLLLRATSEPFETTPVSATGVLPGMPDQLVVATPSIAFVLTSEDHLLSIQRSADDHLWVAADIVLGPGTIYLHSHLMALTGERLVVLDHKGLLTVVDVGDPLQPQVRGQIKVSLSGLGDAYFHWLAVDGPRVLVGLMPSDSASDKDFRLVEFDLERTGTPVQRAVHVVRGFSDNWAWVGLWENRIHLISDGELRIIDLTDPSALVERSRLRFAVPGGGNIAARQGDRLFVLQSQWRTFSRDWIVEIDVADPDRPVPIGETELGDELHEKLRFNVERMDVHRHGLLVQSDDGSGVALIDLARSIPTVRASNLPDFYQVGLLAASSRGLYTMADDELRRLDAHDLGKPAHLLTYQRRGITAMALADGMAYLLHDDGLSVLREEDLDKPGPVESLLAFPIRPRVLAIGTEQGVVAVATGEAATGEAANDVSIVSVRDPNHILVVSTLPVPDGSHVTDMTFHGNLMALALDGNAPASRSVQIFDISDPRRPAFLSTVPADSPASLAIAGDRLFVAATDVAVFDLAQPRSPRRIGFASLWDHGWFGAIDILVWRDRLFILMGSGLVEVRMIADQPPAAWPVITHFQTAGMRCSCFGLAFSAPYLYVNSWLGGMVAYRLPLNSVQLPALTVDRPMR